MNEENETFEFKLYDFMSDPTFLQMTTVNEFIDYFMVVKQDVLIQLDSVQCAITGAELKLAQLEANELLTVDFKAVYGKANERIEKAHMKKTFAELYEQLEGFKFQKKVLYNQLDILNDMIKANQILLAEPVCTCQGDEDEHSL